MISAKVITRTMKSGAFRLYLWGSANGHISDWRGCNYRYMAAFGFTTDGFEVRPPEFDSIADANRWARRFILHEDGRVTDEVDQAAYRRGNGSHLSDNDPSWNFLGSPAC